MLWLGFVKSAAHTNIFRVMMGKPQGESHLKTQA